MATKYSYPGVYIEEVPSGVRTISGVSTSITAFVGFTQKGPVNQQTRILTFGDFERIFGGLHRDSFLSYAVKQFFLNGGKEAIVVRVAKDALAATVTLRDRSGDDISTISAKSEGDWGNLLRCNIDYKTSHPDSTFNLMVHQLEQRNGELVIKETEILRNLSMNSKSPNYAPNVVEDASRFIKFERTAGLDFDERGYSLSGNLSPFPELKDDDTKISGILDGVDPFSIILPDVSSIDNINKLVSQLTIAIAAVGLNTRLEVKRVNALGADATLGNHIKLTALSDPVNPIDAEFSSITITKAPSNDASKTLLLGLNNGGREKEGASQFRPVPNGAISGDLAQKLEINTNVIDKTIYIKLFEMGNPVAFFEDDTKSITTPIDENLPTNLQNFIRLFDHPALKDAVVDFNGTHLHIQLNEDNPNVYATFSGDGAGTNGLLISGASNPSGFNNIVQYSVGVGKDNTTQANANLGVNGIKPTALEIIGSNDTRTGIYALQNADIFNILCIPDTIWLDDIAAKDVISKAMKLCEDERAFYIVDPDKTKDFSNIITWVQSIERHKNGAVFFPRVKIADPLSNYRLTPMPASGTIAGIFARTDGERGIWKAPAGTEAIMRGVQELVYTLTDAENGVLNPEGINCLRSFPASGIVQWGARTLEGYDSKGSEWKYIPVRRMALYLEESLFRGTQWVVFEPNDEPLWAQIRMNVGAFMHNLFRQGAFQGSSSKDAYFVKCDGETTTQADIDLGIVNILVGFAPLKPAEFVVIKISQIAGNLEVE